MVLIFLFIMIKKKKKRGPAPGSMYYEIERTELGKRLAALRRERGLSQSDVAKKTDLTVRIISFYERNAANIPLDRLVKLARVFSVSIDEIAGYEPPASTFTTNRAFLKRLELAKRLPPHQQKILSDMIDTMVEKEKLEDQKND